MLPVDKASSLLENGSLFLPGVAAEIARAGGICHGSSSRTLWRQARSQADTGVADERVRGFLIKRCRPLEAVALLELRKRPLCPRAYYTVERATVETHIAKL